jgi:hypothetical protein
MSSHIIYAYVDGSDLHEVAAHIESMLEGFVRGHRWQCAEPMLVNTPHPPDSAAAAGDLPLWDLGLNLAVPAGERDDEALLADLVALTEFLAHLHRDTTRDFVLGIADLRTGTSEDCLFVGEHVPSQSELRMLL